MTGDFAFVHSVCGWIVDSADLIIITSSLGRVLRGGVNALWVKALLRDVEHFLVLQDHKVCTVVGLMGEDISTVAYDSDEECS